MFIEYLFHAVTVPGSGVNKRNEIDVAPALMRFAEQKSSMDQEEVGKTDIHRATHLKVMDYQYFRTP